MAKQTKVASTVSPEGETVDQHRARLRRNSRFAVAEAAGCLAYELSKAMIGHRMNTGMTQTDLAKQLGMTSAEVSRLESGDHKPNATTVDRVLKALGKRVEIIDCAAQESVVRQHATAGV